MILRSLLALSLLQASPASAAEPAPAAGSRRIPVDEAVALALQSSPGLAAALERAQAADSQASSLRGRLLPNVHVEDEFQHYNHGFSIPFGALSFDIREQNTNTFVTALTQPVLGLIHLGLDLSALQAGAQAAGEGASSVETAVREAVQSGYLRYFESVALVDIAKASQKQLEEQHQIAQARVKAGVLTNADLLRLEVAEANVRQQQIQAQIGVDNGRTALLLALGLDPNDRSIELVEPTALENAAAPVDQDAQAQEAAVQQRHEVKSAELQATAAQRQAHAKLAQLLPEVNGEAAYLNIVGQPLAEKESVYVGVKASWNVWEWGASYYSYRAAEHQARAAQQAAEEQRRQVKLEASGRLAQAKAAATAVQLAQTTISSAEEAYRVTNELVKAGSATTTDLLDSQSALTQARLNLVRARYEQALAIVAYARAIGR